MSVLKNKDGTVSSGVKYTGATIEKVTLQNSVAIPNEGKIFEVDSARTLTVEIFGTSTSRTVKFEAQGASGKWYAARGVKISDQTFAVATETTGNEELWQFDLIGMRNFRARVHAVSGGSVSIKGESSVLQANLSPISNQNLNMNITGQAQDLQVKLSGRNVKQAAVLNVTTAGTRVRLPDVPCSEVMIIAKEENTGNIFVGLNNVSSTVYGAKLKPEGSVTFPCTNANEIYIDASANGAGVSYVAV